MVDLERTGGKTPPFFVSPELTQRLDLLRHLAENSQLIPVVLGPEGSGKSSLIRQLCGRAGDNWIVCPVEAHPMLQPESLLSLLANTFAISAGEDLLERLVDRFEVLRLDGRLPVVILDDAHLLPEATIITLLRLHERGIGRRAQVRILLFGEPEFDVLLATPQVQAMNTQVLQRLEMPRLTRGQTEEFAGRLLAAADQTGMSGLNAAQLDKLYRESEGVPGRIERKVKELVGSGAAGRWYTLPLSRVSPGATLAGILVVTVLLLILIFQDEINGLFGNAGPGEASSTVPAQGAGTVELALPSPDAVEPEPTPIPESGLPLEVGVPAAAGQEESPAVPEVAMSESEPVPEESGVTPEASTDTEEIDTEAQEPAAAAEEPEAVPEQSAGPVAVEPESSPEPQQVATQAVPPEAVAATPPPATPPVADKPAKPSVPETAPAPAQVPEPPATATEEPPVKPGIRREAWLLQQDPKAYTLQLVALSEEAGIARFLERFSLPGQAAYFRTVREGKPWFSLLYGIYPDHQAAVAARDRLPPELQRAGVWPRSLGSVQEEIRSR